MWFIEEMLLHKDVRMTKIAYFAYLDGQKGRYSEKDLGKLWSDIAHRIQKLRKLFNDFNIKTRTFLTKMHQYNANERF